MASSISSRTFQRTSNISKGSLLMAAVTVAVGAALVMASLAPTREAAPGAAPLSVRQVHQQPIFYVVDSFERAQAVSQWHVGDARLAGTPFATLIASTAEEGVAVERILRDTVLFTSLGGYSSLDVQDLRGR